MEDQKTAVRQSRTQSKTWWAGMICCAAQGVVSVLVAANIVDPEVCAAITAALAAALAYCNGNNPSLKDVY